MQEGNQPAVKKMFLEHAIFANLKECGYVDLASKLVRDRGLLSTIHQATLPSPYNSGKSDEITKRKLTGIISDYAIYVYTEPTHDEFGRRALYRHCILVPNDLNLPMEKMPFITCEDSRKKYLGEDERRAIPPLKVEVE